MENKKLKEEIDADKAVSSVKTSLNVLTSKITNKADFAKVMLKIMDYIGAVKPNVGDSLKTDNNFKLAKRYLDALGKVALEKPAVGAKENPAMVKPAVGTKENPTTVVNPVAKK